MLFESRPDEISYRGRSCTIEMLAWWCTQCEEAIFAGEPLAAREKAFLQVKARVDSTESEIPRRG